MPKIIFPQKASAEVYRLVFDFSSYLEFGELLTTTTLGIIVHSGVDAAIDLALTGVVTQTGTQGRYLVTGGVDGVTYLVTCRGQTDNGAFINLFGYLSIVPEGS